MFKRRWRFAAVAALFVLLPGCQDYEEINNLAIVNMIGVDRTEDGTYVGYYQVINPAGVAAEKGGATKATVYTYRYTGKTTSEIAYTASRSLPRKLFIPHYQAYIVSERMARQGLRELLNFLETEPTRRMATDMFITKEPMDRFMYSFVSLEKLPGRVLRSITKLSEQGSGVAEKQTRIKDLLQNYDTAKPTFLTMMELYHHQPLRRSQSSFENISGNAGSYHISGAAILRKDTMIGELKPDEAATAFFMNGTIRSLPVYAVASEGKTVEFRMLRQPKVKKKLTLEGGKPVLRLALKANVALTNNNLDESLSASDVEKLQNLFNLEMEKRSRTLLAEAKSKNWDLLGIEEQIKRKRGNAWNEWKSDASAWKTTKVILTVESTVTTTGAMTKPYKEE